MAGLIRLADEAEARGDAAAALQAISRQPLDERGELFWRPWRIARLEQLLVLEPFLPRWVVSRWILEQALQACDPATSRSRHLALAVAVGLRGGRAALPGVDEVDAISRVTEDDWVYRQLYLYDHGGLAAFLRRGAAADLVAGADRVREWASASMGALRFVGRDSAVLHWADVATGAPVDLPNLGAAALVLPGETVIGRVVPTSEGPMFEGTPLQVPPDVAAAVAADPGDWVGALRRWGSDPEECRTAIMRGNHLLTDVPQTVWQFATLERAGRLDASALTPDVLAGSGAALVLAALRGELDTHVDDAELDPWPCVAAVLCDPPMLGRLAEELRPVDAPGLLALADRLFGPAAAICRELAAAARAAA